MIERSIETVFVANRGEIAARIQRTAARLGIACVVPLVDGPDALDLLAAGDVIAAATAAGADALHPGYGFLAENAAFAEAVEAAGIRWIGPPAAAIRAMGDKAAARRIARDLGVPVLAGYDGEDQRDETLVAAADEVGYPILVKPSAGGGGKGMRLVTEPAELPAALAAARREATVGFGDDRLILERALAGPRHVELQVLFDRQGAGVHLGERDCSLQRRHQKVLEESPSPAVGPELRARMGVAAVRLAEAVGYASAGTCEFLLEDDGRFSFIEMNTRLQVEHPVSELVTGRDLVADQLAIAAGRALDLRQDEVVLDGHAIEVRLYAEDAEAGFLPATGHVAALRWPAGPGIRVDTALAVGDEIGGRFDPLLAKIVAHGRNRTESLERLRVALDETVVLGLVTNLRFLRWALREPAVQAGEVRIDTLDRTWQPGVSASPDLPDAELAALASELVRGRGAWSGGWRINAPAVARVEIDGVERVVRPEAAPIDGLPLFVRTGSDLHVDLEGRSVTVRLAAPPDVERAARAASAQAGGASSIAAPMPGRVLAVHVADGTVVERGDPVITLEAMKMEHVVAAPRDGRVSDTGVAAGDQVVRGQVLARIGEP